MASRLARALRLRWRGVTAVVAVVVAFAVALLVWTRGADLGTSGAQAARVVGAGAGAVRLVTTGPSLPSAGDEPAPTDDGTALPNGTHDVVITVTSDRPLLTVTYGVKGRTPAKTTVRQARSPLRVHELAHGDGLVASVAAQAAPDATEVSCSVSVDGSVRQRHTLKGGYEVVVCLG